MSNSESSSICHVIVDLEVLSPNVLAVLQTAELKRLVVERHCCRSKNLKLRSPVVLTM